MRRMILAGGLAIVGVLVVSIAFVLRVTRPLPAPPLEGPVPGAEADGAVAPASPPAPEAAPRDLAAGVAHRRVHGRPPSPETADGSTSASRAVRVTVRRALLASPVQSRLARCVDAADGPAARGRAASVVLELEIGQGAIRIEDATVLDWGGMSPQAMACARDALREQVVAAPDAEGEARVRMPYRLSPRPEVAEVESSRKDRDPSWR